MRLESDISLQQDDRKVAPCVFVLFGATGDLAARKIAPALYNLHQSGMLHPRMPVLGVARRNLSDEQFRQQIAQSISEHSRTPLDQGAWHDFSQRWHYTALDLDKEGDFQHLAGELAKLDRTYGTVGNRLFYLAVAPDYMPRIAASLANVNLNRPTDEKAGFVRLILEKPFGHDLTSARQLNRLLLKHYSEAQIYRIDHYLGKETVQNILVLRFSNSIFEPLLNRHYVQSVQITTAETVGMEGRRGSYYETAGALRDMVQSHMLQLLSLITMEAPACLHCDDIRTQKAILLRSLEPLTPEDVARWTVRGQYQADTVGPSYLQEQNVSPDSQIETFAALKLTINNWRWAGVPFFLRTGKRLARKTSQIVISFRREPVRLFEMSECEFRSPNRLIIRITPDEGVILTVDTKVPGSTMLMRPMKMGFDYGSSFASASPEAYENLLLDALLGDQTLFIRNDEVEASWKFIDSVRKSWDVTGQPAMLSYPPGSWGPPQAQALLDDPYENWHDY